jgi:hypothetical protein
VKIFVGARHAVPSWEENGLEGLPKKQKAGYFYLSGEKTKQGSIAQQAWHAVPLQAQVQTFANSLHISL